MNIQYIKGSIEIQSVFIYMGLKSILQHTPPVLLEKKLTGKISFFKGGKFNNTQVGFVSH